MRPKHYLSWKDLIDCKLQSKIRRDQDFMDKNSESRHVQHNEVNGCLVDFGCRQRVL